MIITAEMELETSTEHIDPRLLRPHPSAQLIPMADSDIQALYDDITKYGIIHALDISPSGDILDGVHRWQIAQKLELSQVPVCVYRYEHAAEEHLHALRSNLKRRHLNEGQRGGLALLMLPYEEELNIINMAKAAKEAAKFRTFAEMGRVVATATTLPDDSPLVSESTPNTQDTSKEKKQAKGNKEKKQGKSAHKAGKTVGVSADTVYKAKKLQEDSPALFNAMMQGEISVTKAYTQVKSEEKVQEVKQLLQEERPLTDLELMKKLGLPVQPYDVWNFPSCDDRFGHDYPGRIPGQLVAHCLYFWTEQGDTVLDPMAGSGTTIDVCNVLNRRVLAYDAHPCREDIMQHNLATQGWPRETADAALIFWDPPYFKKKDDGYGDQSISRYARAEYLDFFLQMARSVPVEFKGRLVFLMSDYTEEDDLTKSIWITDYINIFTATEWKIERIIQTPLTTQSIHPDIVKKFRESKRLARLGRGLVVMSR